MIIKENTNAIPADKFGRAGYDAERNVAFKLKMAFGENPNLLILNDLKVESEEGITAQMDHLVIHQHGIIIIESKSVAGNLVVEDDGQWIVWYGKDKNGRDNPIKQAEIQGKTLRKVLSKCATNEHTRKSMEALHTDVLVAFSTKNGGTFFAKDKKHYPQICPDHALDDRVNEIITMRTKNAKVEDFSLSEVHRSKLAELLVKIHKTYQAPTAPANKPYTKPAMATKPLKVEQKVSEYIVADKPKPTTIISAIAESVSSAFSVPDGKFKHACRKCKSDRLEVRFGKNYYFKCLTCDENNRIDACCPKCKSLLKIRKDKTCFFAECIKCNTLALFHNNG